MDFSFQGATQCIKGDLKRWNHELEHSVHPVIIQILYNQQDTLAENNKVKYRVVSFYFNKLLCFESQEKKEKQSKVEVSVMMPLLRSNLTKYNPLTTTHPNRFHFSHRKMWNCTPDRHWGITGFGCHGHQYVKCNFLSGRKLIRMQVITGIQCWKATTQGHTLLNTFWLTACTHAWTTAFIIKLYVKQNVIKQAYWWYM